MNLERFIYIDAPGIASLYAQLRGEDVVETLCSMETSHGNGLKLAIAGFLGIGGSGELSHGQKEVKAQKMSLRPENMLREISASLRAHGSLHSSLVEAIKSNGETREPAWFDSRHPFVVPLRLNEFNRMRAIVFVAGFPPYDESAHTPQISMSASLHHFPSVRNGQLSFSGHDALFFRNLNGKPHSYAIFGSVFACGGGFQVKPYAIRI